MPPAQPRFTPQRSVASGDEGEGGISGASSPVCGPGEPPLAAAPPPQPAATWKGGPSRPQVDPTRWGWTAHQSHGQATLLFLVPREVSEDDLDVRIGSDYVVAGLRGAEPTIKARLSGRVNQTTSTWTLEKRSRRSDSHKQTSALRRSSRARPTSRSELRDASVHGVREAASSTSLRSRPDSPASSAASSYDMVGPDAMAASYSSVSDLGRDHLSRTARSRSPYSPSSPGSLHSPPHHLAPDSSPSLGSSPLSQSIVLSPASEASHSGSSPVSSRSRSQGDADLSSSGTLSSRRTDHDDVHADGMRSARLVTIHLDKVDTGVWGCLVAGAPPLEMTVPRPSAAGLGVSSPGSQSLTDALSEALRAARASHAASELSASDGEGNSALMDDDEAEGGDDQEAINQSTATVDTIGSDDSNTVLGARPLANLSAALERGEGAERPASLAAPGRRPSRETSGIFQLDPTSLTLLGMKHATAAAVQPWKANEEADLAFKFFAYAFRNGEVPQAIERLVEEYLPLSEVMASPREILLEGPDATSGRSTTPAMAWSSSSDTCQGRPSVETVRPLALEGSSSSPVPPSLSEARHARRLRVLGGTKELARLYVCYARLSLPSFESQLSPLSFPSSGSTNPYAAASRASSVTSATSSRGGPASSAGNHSVRPNSPGAEGAEGRSQARKEMSMARLMVQNGPLVYLNAARALDPDVFIGAEEPAEASLIAHNAALEVAAEEAADDAEEDAEGLPYYSSTRSESSEPHLGDSRHRRKRGSAAKGRRSGRRPKGSRGLSKSKAGLGQDAGLIPMALVSGAALVGFAVAGAVAVGQIWRRTAGAQAV